MIYQTTTLYDFIITSGVINITQAFFYYCVAETKGGAIALFKDSNFFLTDSTFKLCSATVGSVIYAACVGNISIKHSCLSDNKQIKDPLFYGSIYEFENNGKATLSEISVSDYSSESITDSFLVSHIGNLKYFNSTNHMKTEQYFISSNEIELSYSQFSSSVNSIIMIAANKLNMSHTFVYMLKTDSENFSHFIHIEKEKSYITDCIFYFEYTIVKDSGMDMIVFNNCYINQDIDVEGLIPYKSDEGIPVNFTIKPLNCLAYYESSQPYKGNIQSKIISANCQEIIIQEAVMISIESLENGGALECLNPKMNISISTSSLYHCYSKIKGGAVYASSYNVIKMVKCYFENCTARDGAILYLVDGVTNNFDQVMFYKSPQQTNELTTTPIFLQALELYMTSINSSNHHILGGYGFLSITSISYFYLKRILIEKTIFYRDMICNSNLIQHDTSIQNAIVRNNTVESSFVASILCFRYTFIGTIQNIYCANNKNIIYTFRCTDCKLNFKNCYSDAIYSQQDIEYFNDSLSFDLNLIETPEYFVPFSIKKSKNYALIISISISAFLLLVSLAIGIYAYVTRKKKRLLEKQAEISVSIINDFG